MGRKKFRDYGLAGEGGWLNIVGKREGKNRGWRNQNDPKFRGWRDNSTTTLTS